ncbi:ribonuclease H-like domain-containing protein [Tanacetum coccineum]|uniref:Ribonuclease H-like domain-containing protein n=1 Tax=Tanacetum coccineum TaxID=301880 RepID=A0ABQ4XQI3_9ASTR
MMMGRVNFTTNDEGNVFPCSKSTQASDDSGDEIATSMGENTSSEGTVPSSSGLNAQNLPENISQVQPKLRRSDRNVKVPAKFNDYVVGSSMKYGLEKYVSYSNLSKHNYYFSTTLNKSTEPTAYYESTGAIDRYKARQVANGFSERKGFNYMETLSKFDYSLFTKKSDKVFIALLVYVDDIMITGNNLAEIEKFKIFFKSKFQIKDLGKLKYFLGIEVLDNKEGICLSRRKYCLELLHEYGLLAAKHVDTPLPENTTLNHIESDEDHLLDNIGNYQKLVGKLIYLTNTRPDISYVVHCLSQYMHAPLVSHLDAALRVLRYLKGSPWSGIQINKSGNLKLRAYADSDWARCPARQEKAEYRSMASATCEIDVHLVREKVANGVIKTKKIYTTQQIANVLTKALDFEQHKILCDKLGMLDMFKVEKLKGRC